MTSLRFHHNMFFLLHCYLLPFCHLFLAALLLYYFMCWRGTWMLLLLMLYLLGGCWGWSHLLLLACFLLLRGWWRSYDLFRTWFRFWVLFCFRYGWLLLMELCDLRCIASFLSVVYMSFTSWFCSLFLTFLASSLSYHAVFHCWKGKENVSIIDFY